MLQPNDSGAPLMYGDGTNLNLIGINWFNGTNGLGQSISGDTFLPNYRDDINEIVTAAGETMGVSGIIVPEPSGVLLSGLGTFVFSFRRKRT